MKLKVYIAGKVSPDSVFGTHDWRDEFCTKLSKKSGFEIVNVDPTKGSPGFDPDQNDSQLVFGRNCYMQKLADMTIVYLTDDISVGASQEMLVAKYYGKPLVAIAPKGGRFNVEEKELFGKVWKNYIHPNVLVTCDKVVNDLDELADYLKAADFNNSPAKDMSLIDEAFKYYKNGFLDKDSYIQDIKNNG